jgi:cell division protease FtsH
MGGRLAEEIIVGQITTGAGNDIEVASDLARRMTCEWGMSEKLGPLAFGKPEGEVFLGRELSRSNNYSESTAVEIDSEVRRVVLENYERAKQVILANLDKLKAIAEALLEYETIDTADIDVLMNGGKIDRPPPVRANTSSFSSPKTDKDKPATKLPSFFPGRKEEPEPA